MRHVLIAASCAALLIAVPAIARPRDCPAESAAAADVEATIKTLFVALGRGDRNAAREMFSPDFHAFDAGRHFDRDGLLDLVEQATKRGVKLQWTIGSVESKIDCDIAWAHWINTGSVEDKPTVWQESAVLRRVGDKWRLEFLHSERIVNRPAS